MPAAAPTADRRPDWLQRLTARQQPPMPTVEPRPFEDAMARHADLVEYTTRAAAYIREGDEDKRRMAHEIEALRREVDHVRDYMGEQIADLTRKNALLSAYATNLRTRLTVIREGIVQAETEALQFAANEVRERQPTVNVPDEADVRNVVASIHRANDKTPLAQNRM
jgi:hypothetical protein